MTNWIEREPRSEFWEPKEAGDTIEGLLFEIETVNTKNGPKQLYTVELPDKSKKKIWGSKNLDERIYDVQEQTQIKIVLKGFGTTKQGKPYREFQVFFVEPEVPF